MSEFVIKRFITLEAKQQSVNNIFVISDYGILYLPVL